MSGLLDLDSDPAITDELFNAELLAEEPCDESNHEGTEEESSDDDLSHCAGAEECPAPALSADGRPAPSRPARTERKAPCKARLGPVRLRACRVGQIETRVVDFFFPEDGRAAGGAAADSASAAEDAASAAPTPSPAERKWPLYYKASPPRRPRFRPISVSSPAHVHIHQFHPSPIHSGLLVIRPIQFKSVQNISACARPSCLELDSVRIRFV